MDSAGVLLALEERKKWTARKRRIEERLRQLERRRSSVRRELERARKKAAAYNALLTDLKERLLDDERPLPPSAIR